MQSFVTTEVISSPWMFSQKHMVT